MVKATGMSCQVPAVAISSGLEPAQGSHRGSIVVLNKDPVMFPPGNALSRAGNGSFPIRRGTFPVGNELFREMHIV
jgi:hypothetical protein